MYSPSWAVASHWAVETII
jgi:hypothetical protein